MKNIYLLLIFLFTCTTISAQITLNTGDMAAAGATFYMATDTLAAGGENEGPSGTNQSWDFSMLTTHDVDTIVFFDPTTSPFASLYPQSNIATMSIDGDTGYFFLKNTAIELTGLGFIGDPADLGTIFNIELEDPALVMPFPYTYGSSYLDTTAVDTTFDASAFGIPLVDSARYKSTIFRNVVCDGWGELILGQATYASTLRERDIERTVDSIWVKSGFTGWILFDDTDETDSTFRWWDNTRGYILAEVAYDAGSFDHILYVDPNPVGIDDDLNAENMSMYPNPTQGSFRIVGERLQHVSLQIFDVTGREVMSLADMIAGQTVSVDKLPNGTYHVLLSRDGKFIMSRKLVLTK